MIYVFGIGGLVCLALALFEARRFDRQLKDQIEELFRRTRHLK